MFPDSHPLPAAADLELGIIASQRKIVTTAVVLVLVLAFVTVLSMFGWMRANTQLVREARLTYVKLSPAGDWSISQDLTEEVLYYETTVRNLLYDWIERRYSKRTQTIRQDWGVANSMYSPALQTWFQGEFQAKDVADKHAGCPGCPQVSVKVRSHQHIDPLPRHIGTEPTRVTRTFVYADETTGQLNSIRGDTVRKMYRVSWRLLDKASIQQRPDLLRWNPLGLEITEVEETNDETPTP